MNIGEIELRSGLERANIRFYEKEGFLTPTRRENGYRDYSQADLDTLLRIKLLRRLGLRLEEIRAIQNGEQEMDAVLQRRLRSIQTEHRELDAAEQVCTQMRQDQARYDTLDAQRYLTAYENALQPQTVISPAVPESDRVEPVRTPWRRFFARSMDLALTGMAWNLVLAGLLGHNLGQLNLFQQWILDVASWLLLIPLEGLMLSKWGTTPGKWLMGLRVEHAEGRLLTYSEAQARALSVFGRGDGYVVPFYGLYRNWRSYKDLMESSGTEWDVNCDTVVTATEFRWPRAAGYAACTAAMYFFSFLIAVLPARPTYRYADLTVDQFVANYNRAADYFGVDATLQTDGSYASIFPGMTGTTGNIVVPDGESVLAGWDKFHLNFTVEEGILTGISYVNSDAASIWGSTPDAEGKNAIQICVWAFAGADDGLFARMGAMDDLTLLTKMKNGATTMEILDCDLEYRIEDTGDTLPEGSAFWQKNRTATFSLKKK